MSRLFVKNIPKYVTEERIKEHFSQKGTVTDVRIIKKKSGESRQFCYVGFSNEKDAKAAKHYFNGTFFDTRKIEVEFAKLANDNTLDRAWSKYSKGSSAYEQQQQNSKSKNKRSKNREEEENAPNKKQKTEKELDLDKEYFLQLSKPRSQTKVWGDDSVSLVQKVRQIEEKKLKTEDGTLKVISSLVPSKKAGGQNVMYEKTHIKFQDDDDDDDDDDMYEELPQNDLTSMSDNINIAYDEGISDMDYLRSKMTKKSEDNVDDIPEDDQNSEDDANDADDADGDEGEEKSSGEKGDEEKTNEEHKTKADQSDNDDSDNSDNDKESDDDVKSKEAKNSKLDLFDEEEEDVGDTGRLFVKNISFTATEDDLSKHFSKYGELSEVHIPIDRESKKAKGIAFITYMIPSDALSALNALDNTIFQGRILHISPSKAAPIKESSTTSSANSSFLKKKELEQKLFAEDDTNWNFLFMRSDTVADAVSSRFDVRKGDFLNASADNLAVRMALAETNIIQETKSFLLSEGINLDVLRNQANKKVQRSNTVILAKNLPFETTVDDIRNLFGKFGVLGRVVLPPSRAICIIEFIEPNSAKSAFRDLAYTRFKHVPLYLEWTPLAVFTTSYSDTPKATSAAQSAVSTEENDQNVDDHDDDEGEQTSTLYVKNLNFRTTEEQLRNHFAQRVGETAIRSATIAKRANTTQSLGFGFVEFTSKNFAVKAMKLLQDKELDSHTLHLKFSSSRQQKPKSKRRASNVMPEKPSSNKLLVKNLAFEATKNDLKQLFTSFGEVKSIRVPKKFDGKTRGYAFVEFLTKQEAKNALEALAHTHLYGRHLVIEYAKDEQKSVEELRSDAKKRAAKL